MYHGGLYLRRRPRVVEWACDRSLLGLHVGGKRVCRIDDCSRLHLYATPTLEDIVDNWPA